MTVAASGVAAVGVDAVADLRSRRRVRRLGRLEWFDVAYKAYVVVIFGGGALLWVSAAIAEAPITRSLVDVERFGPSLVSLIAAAAVLTGLRTGTRGGPLSLETADVRHVLLAPVSRRAVLFRPTVQRLRTAVVVAGGAGAVAGQLAGRRLPGSTWSWAVASGAAGALIGALWMAAALIGHRRPRWSATAIGGVMVGVEAMSLWRDTPSSLGGVGRLAFSAWPGHLDGRVLEAAIVAVVAVAALGVGFASLERMSLEALLRRSALVAQLRFAATMQDLRTVVLLRRELDEEHPRARPWCRLGPTPGGGGLTATVWRRDWHGLLRFPLGRVARIALESVALGVSLAVVLRGTTSAVAISALIVFVLGLEVLEPLSQEVDQPDLADAVPVLRGELLARHLVAPAVVLVPCALVAGATAVLAVGAGVPSAVVAALMVLAVPLTLAGAAGSVVSIVRDAPDPVAQASGRTAIAMPEVTGMGSVVKAIWPVMVSGVGVAMVLFVRAAWQSGGSPVGGALRGSVAAVLLVALVAHWVRRRDQWRGATRQFVDQGRAASGRREEDGR